MQDKQKQQMATLRSLGMIHVTGLPLHFGDGNALNGRIISSHRRDWGKYDTNNGMLVAILETGEVFLSTFVNELICEVEQVCTKGKGAGVPCSNGEMVFGYHLLARSVDPMWHGNGSSYEFYADPSQAEFAADAWTQKYNARQIEITRQQSENKELMRCILGNKNI